MNQEMIEALKQALMQGFTESCAKHNDAENVDAFRRFYTTMIEQFPLEVYQAVSNLTAEEIAAEWVEGVN